MPLSVEIEVRVLLGDYSFSNQMSCFEHQKDGATLW
jgi:hypothetical protein